MLTQTKAAELEMANIAEREPLRWFFPLESRRVFSEYNLNLGNANPMASFPDRFPEIGQASVPTRYLDRRSSSEKNEFIVTESFPPALPKLDLYRLRSAASRRA